MNITHVQVLEAALQLPEEERLQLASELLDSVPGDAAAWGLDDPRFFDELDRRLQDGTPSIPWSQVRGDLMAD